MTNGMVRVGSEGMALDKKFGFGSVGWKGAQGQFSVKDMAV